MELPAEAGTLAGNVVKIEKVDGNVIVGGRKVIMPDIMATDGIHWVNDGAAPHDGAWSTRTLLAHVLPPSPLGWDLACATGSQKMNFSTVPPRRIPFLCGALKG
jgi:hypothetical protein